MQYKALFLDLDGTTIPLSLDAVPSPRVTEAIHKAKERVKVFIATSRPLDITKHIFDHLSLSGLAVVNGGTQIYDPLTQTVIEDFPLPPQQVQDILSYLRRKGIRALTQDGKEEREDTGEKITYKVLNVYVPKITFAQALLIEQELQANAGILCHKMPSWTPGFMGLDITAANASKLHGITYLKKKYNLRQEEIIGVGDSYNDFPLLMACGLKVAMGNAAEELKAIADFIAPTVDEDGVAVVIEKYILENHV